MIVVVVVTSLDQNIPSFILYPAFSNIKCMRFRRITPMFQVAGTEREGERERKREREREKVA